MSTFRIARHGVDMDTGAVGVDRRAVLVAIFLCVALFAGCFALGRAASPRSRPAGQPSSGLPVAFAGTAVPFRLSSAPAIRLRSATPKRPAAHALTGQAVTVLSAPAIVRAPTPVTPSVQTPVRQVPSAPAPVRSSQPAPTDSRAGEGDGQSSQPHTSSGTGTSFDSSG